MVIILKGKNHRYSISLTNVEKLDCILCIRSTTVYRFLAVVEITFYYNFIILKTIHIQIDVSNIHLIQNAIKIIILNEKDFLR